MSYLKPIDEEGLKRRLRKLVKDEQHRPTRSYTNMPIDKYLICPNDKVLIQEQVQKESKTKVLMSRTASMPISSAFIPDEIKNFKPPKPPETIFDQTKSKKLKERKPQSDQRKKVKRMAKKLMNC